MTDEATGTEFDTDLEGGRTTQTSARGRGNGRGKKVTQVTKREFIETPDDLEDERVNLPGMFALSDVEGHSIVRIRVFRKDPDEGMLGYIEDPNDSESAIVERWGGGQFQIQGLNNIGQVKASRTFRIAGDPIFVSETARMQWEKRTGVVRPGAVASQAGMNPTDILAFMRQMDEARTKADDERRAREAEERRAHEERMRKLELEAEDRRRKDELEREDRRRKDEAERDEKRRREAAEAEDRRRRDAAEADARNKQHVDMMLTMMKTSSEQALNALKAQTPANPQHDMMNTIKMVVAIKEAFAGEGGGAADDTDPLNLLIKHGHEWLTGLGTAVTGAIREVKGGGAQQPQVAAPHPTAALPSAPEGLVIPRSSPIASKLETLVSKIAARGGNPETILSQTLDNMHATLDGQPPPHQPPQQPQQPQHPQPTSSQTAPPAPPAPTVETPATSSQTGPKSQIAVEKTKRGSTKISFG